MEVDPTGCLPVGIWVREGWGEIRKAFKLGGCAVGGLVGWLRKDLHVVIADSVGGVLRMADDDELVVSCPVINQIGRAL